MKLRNKKTGEIIENACIGVFKHQSSGDCERVDTEARSLEKVLEEWEDYKPTEPLIKDEKARVIFKMWADNFKNKMVDGSFTFYVDREYQSFMVDIKPTGEPLLEDVAEIDLNFDCDGLEDGKSYTLAELCGEEEE